MTSQKSNQFCIRELPNENLVIKRLNHVNTVLPPLQENVILHLSDYRVGTGYLKKVYNKTFLMFQTITPTMEVIEFDIHIYHPNHPRVIFWEKLPNQGQKPCR